MKIVILFVFASLMFTGCNHNPENCYKSKIIGKWEFKRDTPNIKSHVREQYFANGKLYSNGIFIRPKSKLKVEWTGVWTINKNKLNFKVTKSNLPNRLCAGSTWTETIISINENEFIVEESDGTKNTLKRIK